MQTLCVFDIQRYSIHDGAGIRTTIFFKGCPLRCQWCHNPESQRQQPELLHNPEKCTGCGRCQAACPQGAIRMQGPLPVLDREACTCCGACVEACLQAAREISGHSYTVEQLVAQAGKDAMFYEDSGGGVTLSGGEVLAAQPFDAVVELARRLHEEGYSVNVDTSGYAPYERVQRLLPYADTFLYDIKAMDPEKHKRFIGVDNALILENLRRLSREGGRIWLRLPLVAGVNAADSDMQAVADFLHTGVHVEQINLLPYHNTGKSKYARLGLDYDTGGLFEVPARERLEQVAALFRAQGFLNVKIGG